MIDALRVSVVIVTWNPGERVRAALEGVRAQTARPHEVIVVDNGSSDGTPERIAALYPDVRVLRNATNHGFAAAVNSEPKIFAGNGYGGQYLFVVPEYDIVCVFNGWNIHPGDYKSSFNVLEEIILPAVSN